MPIIKKIIERYKEEKVHYVNTPKLENVPTEYQALASILVAMKMLFIMDDKFEL